MSQSSSSFFNDSIKLRDASQQKRKQARSPAQIEAEFYIAGQQQPHPCSVTDLGTGGLSFITKSTLYQGDKVELALKIQGRGLRLKGEVIRVSGKSIGIKYLDVDDATLQRIQDFIHTSFFAPKS